MSSKLLDQLADKFDATKFAYDRFEHRRTQWDNSAKNVIKAALQSLVNSRTYLWHYTGDDFSFFLNLNDRDVANEYLIQRRKIAKIKGGYLAYLFGPTGKISCVIGFPHLPEPSQELLAQTPPARMQFIERLPPKVIEDRRFEPEEITEELVLQHACQFLDEMLKWEGLFPETVTRADEHRTVGFRPKGLADTSVVQ